MKIQFFQNLLLKTNKESVKWLRDDWKCSVVRAAMGVEPQKGYIDNPTWSKEKIEAVIDGAIENDIYMIIDWHSHHIKLNEAKLFFTGMAKKYGKYPNIIYEIYNEPERDSWQQVKDYSIDLIKTIRAIDPDNIILIGNPHWDQDVNLVADDPIKGFSNIMYTLHFYAATHKQELRDKNETCSMLLQNAESSGNWPKDVLKESGIKTRELLRESAGKN